MYIIIIPRNILGELRGIMSFVVADADVAAGRSEGVPGDVEPARASQQLVSVLATLKEDDEASELLGILGTDVGSAGQHVL